MFPAHYVYPENVFFYTGCVRMTELFPWEEISALLSELNLHNTTKINM